jgi:hypothetical protein
VVSCERPAELGLRVLAHVACGVLPRTRVPNEEAGTAQHATVASALEDERPEPGLPPAIEPLDDHCRNVLAGDRGAAEKPHHAAVGQEVGQVRRVLRLW